jgi:hypothetical protein
MYTGFSSSDWKVPNILSQMINVDPKFLSRYLSLLEWWTRWWDGVTKYIQLGPF